MSKTLSAVALLAMLAATVPQPASAQSEVLAEMYGRGVHAYYAGDYPTATEFLTMAIDNGTEDPRAFYFRGLVAHTSGQSEEATSDWEKGAELEANGKVNASIGRSLARFQGAGRLELEAIRQKARLKALATAAARSKARYGQINAAEANVLRQPPQPAPVTPPPGTAAAPRAKAPVPPPPAAADDQSDPFADDMASGQPNVESDDALKGAMEDPFAGDTSIPADAVPPNDAEDPFGGGADAGDPFGDPGGGDPFGGASDAGGGDPFGGADSGGADAGGGDPFGGADSGADAGGGDPFGDASDAGGDDAMEEDPFGGNPFDN